MPKKSAAKPQPKTALKAERIQAPAPKVEPLKAERIQELLRQFPAWRLRGNNRTLAREYELPSRASAFALVQFMAALNADFGRPIRIEWAGDHVVHLLLPLRAGDRLTEADFELARILGGPL